MILVPKRQIWTRQPSHPVGIDWSNPITSQLVRRWNFGVDNYDHVTNVPSYVESGSPTQIASSRGMALSFSGADDSIHSGSGTSDLNGTEISISFWAHNLDGSSNTLLFAGEAGSGNHRISISLPYDGIVYWDFGLLLEGGRITKSVGSLSGQLSHWVFVASGGNYMAMYQDGDLLHSENTGYPTGYAGSSYMSIGSYRGSIGFTGNLSNFAIFKRALDAKEVKSLYTYPWQLDKHRSRHVFIEVGGGGGDVTLDPTTGSVTFSGQTPTITLPVALTPSTGSVVVTGQTPTVTNPLALTPTTGSIVIGGNSPSITLPVALTATTGSVTFTGNQPTVEAGGGVSLTPSTGSVTISGNTPTITLPVDVTAVTGSVTFSGNQPTLNTGADVILTPTTGSVVFSGQTASITLPVALTPSVGNVTLSGNAPTITLPVAITPTTGQLVISGNVPVITLGITSTPLTGEIIITGNQPTFSLAVGLTSITGSLVMTGNRPTMTGTSTLEDAEFLRQSVFVRSAEAREFARINTSSRYFSRRN